MLDAWRDGDVPAAGPASPAQESPGRIAAELSEPEVARELVAALPERAVLWCGNSLSVRDLDLLLPAAGPTPA